MYTVSESEFQNPENVCCKIRNTGLWNTEFLVSHDVTKIQTKKLSLLLVSTFM